MQCVTTDLVLHVQFSRIVRSRWLSERSETRRESSCVSYDTWPCDARISRTGVINLKPIEGRRQERANDTTTVASPRGRWWQITWTRAAFEPWTQLVRATRHAWQVQLVYHCGMYRPQPDDEPANGTSARRIMREQNKLYGCSFLWMWFRRWSVLRFGRRDCVARYSFVPAFSKTNLCLLSK